MSATLKLSRIERLQREIEEKKARLAQLQARDQKIDRARDTRRKIIVGGSLIALARTDPNGPVARAIHTAIGALERPSDKAAFAGWSLSELNDDEPTVDFTEVHPAVEKTQDFR